MARKTWTPKTELTPNLLKAREKRKWQIALRRYVLERNNSPYYAPFFGLGIDPMRSWFELQFKNGLSWEDFGKKWQFDHLIPVNFFDFSNETELQLCWHFLNLRVEPLQVSDSSEQRPDLFAAKAFFKDLWEKTAFPMARRLLEKLERMERSQLMDSSSQAQFISINQGYLSQVAGYGSHEFDQLNSGRTKEQIQKERDLLKKYNS